MSSKYVTMPLNGAISLLRFLTKQEAGLRVVCPPGNVPGRSLTPSLWLLLKGRKAWGQQGQACVQQDATGHLFGHPHQIWWIPKAERLPSGSTPHLTFSPMIPLSVPLSSPLQTLVKHSLPPMGTYLFSSSVVTTSSTGLSSSRSQARTLGRVSSRLVPKSPGSHSITLNW